MKHYYLTKDESTLLKGLAIVFVVIEYLFWLALKEFKRREMKMFKFENSPNTVCEAQLLGIPVIATNVGGTSTLVRHMETGILVSANAPFFMAANIKLLVEDVELASRLGIAGRQTAIDRHNPEMIVSDLVQTVNIIKKGK